MVSGLSIGFLFFWKIFIRKSIADVTMVGFVIVPMRNRHRIISAKIAGDRNAIFIVFDKLKDSVHGLLYLSTIVAIMTHSESFHTHVNSVLNHSF
jgi:hypothetical protein